MTFNLIYVQQLHLRFIQNHSIILFDYLYRIPESTVIDENGHTLFHYFVEIGCTRTVYFLIRRGWNVNVKAQNGDTPLYLAVFRGFRQIVDLILKTAVITHSSYYNRGRDPLHTAISKGECEIVKLLVSSGFEIHVPYDEKGYSALHYAIMHTDSSVACKMIDILADAGVDMNVQENEGFTALHLRAGIFIEEDEVYNNSISPIIAKLIDRGINIDAVNNNGDTALHIISFCSTLPAAKQLIEAGCDVNSQNSVGDTPLHYAIVRDFDIEFIKLLLRNGALVNLANYDNYTPLSWSLQQIFLIEDPIILYDSDGALLSSDEAFERNAYHSVVETLELINVLHEYGASLTSDNANRVPLYVFLEGSVHSKIIEKLLELGSPLDFTQNVIRTCLACPFKPETSKVLLKHAAMMHVVKGNDTLFSFKIDLLPDRHQHFYTNCRAELETMKKSCVCYSVSLFNLMLGSVPTFYTKNQNVLEVFETSRIAVEYPIYETELKNNFNIARERAIKETIALKKITNIFGLDERQFPYIFEHVVKYLPMSDIHNLTLI